jgi:hypothetical protein
MMSSLSKKFTLLIILILALSAAVPVLAAPPAQETLSACPANVSGTVVAVDETTNTVTIEYVVDETTGETAQCTVTLEDKTYDHPIVALLGDYFDKVDAAALQAELEQALDETKVCAMYTPPPEGSTEPGTWAWVARDETTGECPVGAEEVMVVGTDSEGNFLFEQTNEETSETELIVLGVTDEDVMADLNGALETLSVMWSVNDDGTLNQAGDDIQMYHDEGMGFGVLVKLYSIAEASPECEGEGTGEGGETLASNGTTDDSETLCGVTVEDLVNEFNSGVGMGQLFKEYGKPDKTGVGHVRQEVTGKGKALGRNKNNDENTVLETQEPQPEQELQNQDSGPSLPAQAQGKAKGLENKDKNKTKFKTFNNNSLQSYGVCSTPGNGKGKGKGLTKCK